MGEAQEHMVRQQLPPVTPCLEGQSAPVEPTPLLCISQLLGMENSQLLSHSGLPCEEVLASCCLFLWGRGRREQDAAGVPVASMEAARTGPVANPRLSQPPPTAALWGSTQDPGGRGVELGPVQEGLWGVQPPPP